MMTIWLQIAAGLVALEHLYIMWLETVATTSDKTSHTFGIAREELGRKTTSSLLKNQGVYNGLLAVLIFIALAMGDLVWLRLLLGYVVAVAVYGGLATNPMIILKQGTPALLALAVSFFA